MIKRKEDDPKLIASQLSKAEGYNNSLDFYDMCRKNNRFYHGDQWLGLKTAKIQLMTSNFLQRPISYFVSQIVSDDIGFDIKPLIPGAVPEVATDALPDLVDRVFHRNDFFNLNRSVIKQAAIECEGCVHWYFDPNVETSQLSRGDIRCERIPTVNVLFGNPHSSSLQDQPYIIIKRRVPVEQMKQRAKLLGCNNVDDIKADTDSQMMAGKERTPEDGMCTEVLKYWKVTDSVKKKIEDQECSCTCTTVHFCRVVGNVLIQPDTETGYSLYPVSRMVWNEQDGRYHGSCAITSFIPTQITVNRMLTLVCEYVKNFGLPKIFYNKTAFPNGFHADPTRAYGTIQDPNLAVYQIGASAEVPAGIVNLLDKLVETSRDFMGTSDAALGNIRPDNTSAIVATQKATAAPLLLQTMNFYQYVRDCIRIVIDQIGAYYGRRIIRYEEDDTGNSVPVELDFSAINVDEMDLKVSVGAASYWSELTQIQTADNLATNVFDMSDPEQVLLWLNATPTNAVPNRQEIIDYFQKQAQAADMAAQGEAAADSILAEQQIADAQGGVIAPDRTAAQQALANTEAAVQNPNITNQQALDAAAALTKGA